jgi:hypothetical protein
MEDIPDNTKTILASVSTSMKQQKAIKKNDLQNSVLNLENNNFPVGEYLDNIKEQGVDIKSVTMSFGNIDEMNEWEIKDWANSWRGELPSEIKDSNGNLIEFTEENVQDLKAQLALNTFNGMIDTSTLEIRESMNENVKEIAQAFEASGGFNLDAWLSQDFTITLDNYSKLAGNYYGIEMNDFNDLTKFANEIYGTNISPEEYAIEWEKAKYTYKLSGQCGDLTGVCPSSTWGDVTKGVDLIDQVGSFEAASIAASIGTELQTVAESIAQAATVGISTDLEAAASGLGYNSFSDAVAAYNAQYGTSYTEAQAKEALGQ